VGQDSTNPIPNTLKFLDRSTGTPNHFKWNFGDGSASDMRNPRHHYANSGNYTVCLKIIRSDSTGILCTDSLCKQVNVTNYYDLGGHAFAGLYPINNPVSTGDTGIAYLYQINNYMSAMEDSTEFFNLGYFTFPHIPEGHYILKIALKSSSTHYQNYLPTFYPDALQQEKAEQIDLYDSNLYNADIHLHPLNAGISGNGVSDGNIIISDPYPNPASEVMYFKIWSPIDVELKVDVLSIIGQDIVSFYFPVATGLNTVTIPVGSLPAGMYFIHSCIQDGSKFNVWKFLKH
jgi:PKD repeat protein